MSRWMVGILGIGLAACAYGDDWPQWRGPQRDGVWREGGLIERFAGPQIPPKWRQPIGPGYSGPTVAAGRVYITDRQTKPEHIERILCFDAQTGKPLWEHIYPCVYTISYPAGPRACVTIENGRAYALGAMGHLHCLEAASGKVLWKKDLGKIYSIKMPIWGVSAAPLLFQDSLILQIGGAGACIVALDKNNGQEKWKALDDRASYSAPILVQQNNRPVAVCWTGDSVSGLAAESGEILWRHPFPPSRMPIGIATPVVENNHVFVTSFYDGSLMLKLLQDRPAVQQVWRKVGPNERRTEALQSIMSTPIFRDGHLYGVDSYGELRCLDATDGKRIWEDLTATPRARWSNIHFVQNGPRTWMFNERGELVIGKLSPKGFEEISRAKLIEPTMEQLRARGGVCWAHPAFAERCVFIRNDKEIVCASLAK